jgi:hypothetical protein
MKYNNHLKRINSFNRANKPVACDSCEAIAKQNFAHNSREITKSLSNFKFPDVIMTSIDSIPKTKIIVMSNCDGCGNRAK